MLTSEDVCTTARISYRQLDYWVRKGYVKPFAMVAGSGTHREFTEEEVNIVRMAARLIRRGFTIPAALDTARAMPVGGGIIDIGEGVRVAIGMDS